MKNLILFLFLTNGLCCFSQEIQLNSLNKRNSHHKKDGVWVKYLDKDLNEVDKEFSNFYGYEIYDNGKWVMFFSGKKHNEKNAFNGKAGELGKPILLNGTFMFYNQKGILEYEETYKEGMPWLMFSYRFDKDGVCTMKEVLDYSKQYQNTPGTFYYEYYASGALVSSGYYQKVGKKWRVPL
jgi:hypothetical protein